MKKSFSHIVLVGFMGVGKSTLGKMLARETGYLFFDTDRIIEERQNASIPEIFKKKGEVYFRKIEKEVIQEISGKEGPLIIATGGGALLDPVNEKNLKRRGILIRLIASPEEILKRVQKEDHRPLIRNECRLGTIQQLLQQREMRYRTADMTVRTDHKTPDQIFEEIRLKLNIQSKLAPISIQVSLERERSYPILLGNGNLHQMGEYIAKQYQGPIGVITNPLVWKLHGTALRKSLIQAGLKPLVIQIPDGERYKTVKWVHCAISELLKNRFERNGPILAFGGGVIGDLAGFVSGIYLRGTPFIQVPTTLIAQVDSSIGGKTGVNAPLGKNLIGVFHQPQFVWIDTALLQTLKRRDYLSGLAEVIKYGMIADPNLFEFLEANSVRILSQESSSLFHMIKRSCEIKADIVSQDEKESGIRKILNYGHTLGHAIEAVTKYKKFRHGEAIGIGMHYAALLAYRMNECSKDLVDRQKNVISTLRLPYRMPKVKVNDLIGKMALDKKVKDGKVYFILPSKIGEVVLKPVDNRMIRDEIKSMSRLA